MINKMLNHFRSKNLEKIFNSEIKKLGGNFKVVSIKFCTEKETDVQKFFRLFMSEVRELKEKNQVDKLKDLYEYFCSIDKNKFYDFIVKSSNNFSSVLFWDIMTDLSNVYGKFRPFHNYQDPYEFFEKTGWKPILVNLAERCNCKEIFG